MSDLTVLFTVADAQAIISLVERAPLQNMAESRAVGKLLEKFVAFVNAAHAPEPLEPGCGAPEPS